MLRPRAYAAVCEHLGAGGDALLDHDPRGADDGPARDVRFRRTLRLYREHYESEPPAWAWTADAADAAAAAAEGGPCTVVVRIGASGQQFRLTMDLTRKTGWSIMRALVKLGVADAPAMRLLFDGQRLGYGKLAECGVEEGDVIELLASQTGC
jgi:hypothetical protein